MTPPSTGLLVAGLGASLLEDAPTDFKTFYIEELDSSLLKALRGTGAVSQSCGVEAVVAGAHSNSAIPLWTRDTADFNTAVSNMFDIWAVCGRRSSTCQQRVLLQDFFTKQGLYVFCSRTGLMWRKCSSFCWNTFSAHWVGRKSQGGTFLSNHLSVLVEQMQELLLSTD